MPARPRVLVLHATSQPAGSRIVGATLRDTFGFNPEGAPAALKQSARWRYMFEPEYAALSYVTDWLDAFRHHEGIDVDAVDVLDVVGLTVRLARVRRYDLIVILHSATGDSTAIVHAFGAGLLRRRCPLLVFVGNEYAPLERKLQLLRDLNADAIGTQLPLDAARWLYADLSRTRILALPAGLNAAVYRADPNIERTVDIGFRGLLYDASIGDDDRTRLLRALQARSAALSVDIAFTKLGRDEWATRLAGWRATAGAEAGTAFLSRSDALNRALKAFIAASPNASPAAVLAHATQTGIPFVSGKAVSSRHFEAAGAGTVQLLIEGRYNDALTAGEHYIAVRRDLSNLDACLAVLLDRGRTLALAERARSHVMGAHRLSHRVDVALGELVP